MESHRSVSILIRTTLGCCALFSAQFAASQESTSTILPSEPEAVVEAHRLTLGRQFVLFNQVLFGSDDSPQLSIRYAYNPQNVQNWILGDGVDMARLQAMVDERNDVMLLPPSADVTRRRGPYRVSVDRPSTAVTQGQYEIGDGYRVGVALDGVWHVLDSLNQDLSLTDGVPELVYDLKIAIKQKALIGLDTKIEGLDYESFLIEGPLVPP